MTIQRGIDVSWAQGAIDWAQVKASGQVDFVLLREGYGWGNGPDSTFAANLEGVLAQGLPYGVWHYSYAADPRQAALEARSCLENLRGLRPHWPIAYDVEEPFQLDLPPEKLMDLIDGFLEEIEAAGYFAMLYMSASPLEQLYRALPRRLSRYALWVAHVNAPSPALSAPWGLWQHSWTGQIPGICGAVDLDRACVDYPSLIREKGYNGWPKCCTSLTGEELLRLLREQGIRSIEL